MQKHLKGYVYVSLAVLSGVIFALLADSIFREFPQIHPANLLFWSVSGACIIASPYFFGVKKHRQQIYTLVRTKYKELFLIGIVTFAGATLWNYALQASSSGIVTLLGKSTFVISTLLGIIFLKEKLTKLELLSIAFVLVGVVLVANLQGEVSFLANVYMILACLCYAILSMMIKQLGDAIDMKSVAYVRALLLALNVGIFLALTGNLELLPQKAMILGPISECFGIILWAVLYFEAHKYLPIGKLNFFTVLDTAITPLLAFFIFHDVIGWQKFLGACIILFGMYFFFYLQKNQSQKIEEHQILT